VAGSCEYGDEPSSSGATELVSLDSCYFRFIVSIRSMYKRKERTWKNTYRSDRTRLVVMFSSS
jgi:hypothetical protein